MKRSGTATAALVGALLSGACGLALSGCHEGGGGDLIIVTGASAAPSTSSTVPAGSYSVVKSDPAGGTILQSADGSTRKIAGTFQDNVTLEAGYTWVLDAPVFVGAEDGSKPTIMTIQPGTTILGRGGTPPSMLVIRRGARLMADGTAQAPIVFTSAQPPGSRAPGDWGGIVINGRAPVNDIGPNGELPYGEGGSGRYGGTDPHDNSGVLRYVRVEFAGHVFTSDDELNGVAFQGVGDGTVIDYLQVHRNADDGVEFFGGTVSLRHLLITGCLDDSLDWTSGWTGKVQFAVLQQWAGGADNGIEADNLEALHSATPRSSPTISNLTLVGPSDPGAPSDVGFQLRRGTGARILNSIVLGMNEYALDIDDASTWTLAYNDAPNSYTAPSGQLVVSNCFFFASALGEFADDGGDPQLDSVFSGQQAQPNVTGTDPLLVKPQDTAAPDFRLQGASPALTGWVDPADAFFSVVAYRGAMDGGTDWTAGWASFPSN